MNSGPAIRSIARMGAPLVAAALVACGGGGSGAPAAPPQPAVTPASSPLTLSMRAVDALLQSQVAAAAVPGIALGISRNGLPLVSKAYGQGALSPATPADAATEFEIGSITKQFTAACVLILAADGKLRLDEPLSDFIPEYTFAKGITLREMLNMVSGIPASADDAFTTLYGPIDHESAVSRLNLFPLDFAPGTQFEYSNQNYYLLGLAVERASGLSYPQFLATRILTPLGLSHTFYLANPPASDLATGYFHNGAPANPFVSRPPWSADYAFSMGGLISNVEDIMRWHSALLSGQVLDGPSLATMFTVPALAGGASTDYAMGWFVEPTGERWHNGEMSGFHSATALYPDGYDIVLLGNDWDQYSGAWSPENLVLQIHALLPH